MVNLRKRRKDINEIDKTLNDPHLNSAQKFLLAKEKTDLLED